MRTLLLATILTAGCGCFYPGKGVVIDLVPQGSWNDAQLAQLDTAASWWRSIGAGFVRGVDASYHLPVHVAPLPWYDTDSTAAGSYEASTGEIYVNPKIVPDHSMAEFFAHEMGHAISLSHVASGIMQDPLNYDQPFTSLQPDDVTEYQHVWGKQ